MATQFVRLISSMLSSVSYDDETREMQLTFRNGRSYDLRNVPADVFNGLANSSSPGQYYNQNIKGVY